MDAAIPPDCLLRQAARFAQHPAFALAVQAYCLSLARFRASPRLLNAIIATDVRWRIVGYLLYLSADRERFGVHGGATYGRLLSLCTQRQEASPRALKTLLGLLKLSFLVRVVHDERDSRIGYYLPTERLHGFVRSWMRYATAALDILEPDQNRTRFLNDPAFAARFHVSGGRAHLAASIPLADLVPEPIASLTPKTGSFSVVAGLMGADLCGDRPPSPGMLARRFGLSRSQVVNVLAAGREAGAFAPGGDGQLVPTATLRRCFAQWVAIELAFYAQHMRPPDEPVQPVTDTLI